MDPALRRAWPRVRAAESDETAASGTEFTLDRLGSGVLRRSIFPGFGGGGVSGGVWVCMYALYWPMHELANNLEALGGRVTVG